LFTQRFDFPGTEKIQTMDRLAITQGQKLSKQPLDFPVEEMIKTMDRLAIIQGQKIVKTTVAFFSKRKD